MADGHAPREEAGRGTHDDPSRHAAGAEMAGTVRRSVERARAHFTGADAPPDDTMEVWGRRVGRGLSVIAFAALLVYLAVTYL